MSRPIIEVRNVSKRYVLGQIGATSFRDEAERLIGRLTGRMAKQEENEYWALRDVSFDIQPGEVVGLIGRNGAGKSTMLKILSRITEPSSGEIRIRGRIASLLEVGTGFHPELSGRENIFLNGAILGMKKAEIARKFDEIVAFSEIEKFLDTPVKRYSSGMYVRLAFAIAAHLEPEILIIDEVLAVGDAQFQKKCLGKMKDVSSQGRTVLFVSHNMPAVIQLTTKGVYLKHGQLQFVGSTEDAVTRYVHDGAAKAGVRFEVENEARKFNGTLAAKFTELWFDRPTPFFTANEDFSFHARVRANEAVPALRTSMTIFTQDGTPIGSCFSEEKGGLKAGASADLHITLPSPRLAPGKYYCGIAVGRGDHRTGHVDYDVVLDTLSFEVLPEEGDEGTLAHWTAGWGSIVLPELKFSVSSTAS